MDKRAIPLNWSFVLSDIVLSLQLQQPTRSFLHQPSRISLAGNLPIRLHHSGRKTQYLEQIYTSGLIHQQSVAFGRSPTCTGTQTRSLFILLNHMTVRETDDVSNTSKWCFPVQFPTQLGFISSVQHLQKANLSYAQRITADVTTAICLS